MGTTSSSEAFATFIIIVAITAIVIYAIYIICHLVGMWKIFEKAGRPGWAAIIPFYNTWVWGNIISTNRPVTVAWVSTSAAYALAVLCSILAEDGSFIDLVSSSVYGLLGLAMFGLWIWASIATAKSFGQDAGTAVGLVLIPPVFLLILGLGRKQRYIGPGGAFAAASPYGHSPYAQYGYPPYAQASYPQQYVPSAGYPQQVPYEQHLPYPQQPTIQAPVQDMHAPRAQQPKAPWD